MVNNKKVSSQPHNFAALLAVPKIDSYYSYKRLKTVTGPTLNGTTRPQQRAPTIYQPKQQPGDTRQ